MKTKISEWSTTPSSNTDIDGINIAEGCAPSGINDAIRDLMAQVRSWQSGATGDPFNGPVNGTVGATTASTGAFTTISATGAITSTLATGSAPLVIASTTKVANLNVDLLDGADWASPAALGSTTPAAVSATTLTTSSTVTLNGGTANGVAYLNGSKVVTSGSALTFDGAKFGVSSGSEVLAQFSRTSGADALLLIQDSTTTTAPYIASYGNDMAFGRYGGSEFARFTSTGLGIGTSSPAQKLEVNGAALVNGASGFIRAAITGTPSSGTAALQISINSTNARSIRMENTSSGGHTYDIINGGTGVGNLGIYDDTVGAYRLAIDSSGNLGLGVTPSAWNTSFKAFEMGSFSLMSANALTAFYLLQNAYFASGGWTYKNTGTATKLEQGSGEFRWYNAPSGTAGNAITFTQAATLTANSEFLVGRTSVSISGVKVDAEGLYGSIKSGNWSWSFGASASTNAFVINDTTSGSSVERARIDSSGNLLVGTTSNGTYSEKFNVTTGSATQTIMNLVATGTSSFGAVKFRNGSGEIGSISYLSAAVVYNTTSDYRLKTVTGAVTGQGARIDALKPIDYQWTESGQNARGFLAHEFQTVYPNSVTGDKDAVDAEGNPVYQAMQASTAEVIADLVAEIQSLRKRLADAGI